MALPLIPVLVTGAKMLAGAAVRGAAGAAVRGAAAGATRGAITQSVKKVAVDAAKKKAGGLAKSFIKKKITNAKKVSTAKLLPKAKKGGGGGGLVRKKSSAIVKNQTSAIQNVGQGQQTQLQEQKQAFNGDELIQELTSIKETLIKIKGVLGTNLANTLRQQRNQRTLLSKQKASEKEAELEKKPEKKEGGKKLEVPKKKMGFFDMIWNFISNVLMGSLINFLWKYIPQAIKMFEEIAKGMSNTWQQLRIGIITLTTLFPRQIKFLAKLTSKIIGPPAKLIGKLLLKAGSVVGFLFKKAGGIILNLIKGPLLNLIKRVGGEALEQGVKGAAKGAASIAQSITKKGAAKVATRAAIAAGGKGGAKALASSGKLLNRLKIFSKIFKRVPVIGALIGIGIDLAMGEPLDRAVVGAIGASLGTAIGGAIGTGLIPIPIVGSVVGGAVGAAIGDWAAKKFYADLTGRVAAADKAAPIEQRASGGGIGGWIRSIFTRNTPTQSRGSVPTTRVNAAVQQKAKENVLKDEESLRRFTTLSSIFAGTPFIGQLMKLGIDIGMGAKVQKTQTDAAAQDLGFTIGKALEDDEFSVPGLNKRLIGPLSKNLTEWAKTKIFNEVKAREGLFPTIKKSEEKDKDVRDRDPRARGGYDPRYDGPPTTGGGLTVGRWGPLLDVIAAGEGGYESVNPSFTIPGLTKMTIAEADKKAQQMGQAKGGTGAMGRYQLLSDPVGRAKAAGLDPNKDLFSPANQDKIAVHIIENIRKGKEWIAGKMSDQDFLQGIANEWASMPNYYGKYSYSGQGGAIKADKLKKALEKVKSGGYSEKEIESHTKLPPEIKGKVGSFELMDPTPNSKPGVKGSSGYASDSGLDILGKTGDPIVAPAAGKLLYAETGHTSWSDDSDPNKPGKQSQHSFLIQLSKPFKYGGKNIKYAYGTHLSALSNSVANKSGISIKAGQTIGNMGVANKVPHLHLGLLQNRAQSSESDWLSNTEVKTVLTGGQGGDPGPSAGGGSNANPLKLLASDAKTTYYDPSLGGINASGHKTKEGLPATSTGEGYRPNVFSAAAFPPLIAKLPSANLANAPGFPGGKTVKKPLNLVVTSSAGKQAVVRVNDVGPGVKGHASNHMLDFSVAAKNFLGTGKGFKIEGPTSNNPGPLSGSAAPAASDSGGGGGGAPAAAPAAAGGAPSTSDTIQPQKSDFENIIRGDPGIESTIQSIQQKPSYDQGGQKNIVMMPIPQGSPGSQVNPTGGISRTPPIMSSGLNSKVVAARSACLFLNAALYKG